MSVADIRIRVAIEDVGEFSASRAAFHSVSVTVLRQSTHVPNTSKNKHRGCGLAAIARPGYVGGKGWWIQLSRSATSLKSAAA